jgi:D-glycero-D-manno-heptose 1,7-bisphosphate phosphatase
MSKLILLDRDGVLNKELGGYVKTPEAFEVLPYVVTNLKRLVDAGYILVVITNQGGIAKNLYDHEILRQIHAKMIAKLAEYSLVLSEIYYCPHHQDTGKCLCRKPASIMIEKALARFKVNPQDAFMIGDTPRDMEAASAVGVKSYLVESNEDWAFAVDEILFASKK